MRLDYRKTFLLGFGFLAVTLMWTLYNAYVPIYLQAGDPRFDAGLKTATAGFGLSATVAGFIMTLDNIAALFIQPLIGMWSDRTRTRLGRRMPYIVGAAPVAVVAFAFIPMAAGRIPIHLSGNLGQLQGPFAFFMLAVGVMLLAMAVLRTPVIALMPDLIPSPLRSQANGVINFMGGVGGLLASFGGAWLYGMNHGYPFWLGGAVMLVAVIVLLIFIREPEALVAAAASEEDSLGVLKKLGRIPREHQRSLGLLLAAIFCWFVGFNAIETFFTSYGVVTLHVQPNTAALIFGIAQLTFIVFAIPSGFIAGRLGRRRTISLGLVGFGTLLIIGFFVPKLYVIAALMALGGACWALININSLPMVVDISPVEADMGTYTGLYYLASQLAAVAGPVLNGAVIDLTGRNYNMIFLVTPAFFVLALLCMSGVTRGEAHAIPAG